MRSKLFVPGSRPELFTKAMSTSADGISFDLEDAVAESAKSNARQHLTSFLNNVDQTEKTLVVRINAQSTEHYLADLEALVPTRVHIINLPKVESADYILKLVKDLERIEKLAERNTAVRILANIESPKGLRLAAEIAGAHPRVMGLQLGFADLLEPLGIDRKDAAAVRQIQLAVRMAAGEASINTYDSAFAAIKDPDGFRAEACHARALGFSGKSCIHPTQIEIANDAFLPQEVEIAHSLRILEAAKEAEEAGIGVYQVDGQMIDGPFVLRAKEIVRQARQAGLVA